VINLKWCARKKILVDGKSRKGFEMILKKNSCQFLLASKRINSKEEKYPTTESLGEKWFS